MASSEYLNITEAARYLSVSDIKIRRLINKGLLNVSVDPLDDRKRLVKRGDLDSLKTPRPIENPSTRGKKRGLGDLYNTKDNSSNIKKGSDSNES